MEKTIEVSKELDVQVAIKEGKLVVSGDYEGKIGGVKLELSACTDKIIDAICAKIPGQIDDKLGELLKAALKKA